VVGENNARAGAVGRNTSELTELPLEKVHSALQKNELHEDFPT
jgi:hypothetical protein